MIATQVEISGSGKAANGWFPLGQAYVSYDHPFDAPMEHSLNIDFVNQALGRGARVAVELDVASARALVEKILNVLDQAGTGGYLDQDNASSRALPQR